jgi:alkanesulfonate monooxygenase SsuD/methylene tetrahydromethanopterin reductase-like flavin-dependent oxidoreductase (luciferase family)
MLYMGAPAVRSGRVRFGTYFFLQATPGRSSTDIIQHEMDQMVLSEALGFDAVWLTEHHYADYGLSAAPSVLAATLAARTERVTIGTAVYVVPFHHPLRLAEETATLDILSNGRLVVGVGRGNRPLEFVGHGVRLDDSRTRLEEGVDVLVQAWTQERVDFQGQHWQFSNMPVYPKPRTRPHPPLAVAAISPDSIAWTARRGYRLLSSGLGTPLPALSRQRELYLAALGDRDAATAWTVTRHVYVAATDQQARAEAEPHERWYLDSFARSLRPDGLSGLTEQTRTQAAEFARRASERRWEDLIEDSLLIGSPETVRGKVGELEAAGVGELVCWMNFGGLPIERVERSMRLFADEVMPAFQTAPARVG